MTLIEVVVLSLIQGLTEFLPISSSGHLVAARLLFGFEATGSVAFDAYLHLGTLGAVLLYFRTTWQRLLKSLVRWQPATEADRRLVLALVIATIPAALAGYWFADTFTQSVHQPRLLALEFLVTAASIYGGDRLGKRAATSREPSVLDAFLIGCAQIIALFPGVSRSGATIAAARARGLSREQATTFSFLMSAPIIAGAGLVSLQAIWQAQTVPPAYLLIGFLLSLLGGLLTIHWLLQLIKRGTFTPFVIYLVFLAAVIWYVA